MLMKTHLALGAMAILFLLPIINNKLIFVFVVLFVTLLPDIDIATSYLGRKKIFRPLQWFVSHRGVIHSLTLCVIVSFLLAYFIPVLALPFFLGYSLHLFGDSLTSEGIRPFWPLKKEVHGAIRVGGKVEETIFIMFLIFNLILFVRLFI